MFSLKMTQCDAISRILKESDKPESKFHIDMEALSLYIQKEVGVSKEIADVYIESHKFCSTQGAIGALHKAVALNNPITTSRPAQIRYGHQSDAAIKHLGTLPNAPKPGSTCAKIIELHESGMSNDEIIALGYNKSTVYRQVNEHKKRKKLSQ